MVVRRSGLVRMSPLVVKPKDKGESWDGEKVGERWPLLFDDGKSVAKVLPSKLVTWRCADVVAWLWELIIVLLAFKTPSLLGVRIWLIPGEINAPAPENDAMVGFATEDIRRDGMVAVVLPIKERLAELNCGVVPTSRLMVPLWVPAVAVLEAYESTESISALRIAS
jgi:hypothetical protein